VQAGVIVICGRELEVYNTAICPAMF